METIHRERMFALIYEIGNYELLNREKIVTHKMKKKKHAHRHKAHARAHTHERTHTCVCVGGYIIVSETNGKIARQNEEALKRHVRRCYSHK